jgi:structure-specific endonuclease subunit SLX1
MDKEKDNDNNKDEPEAREKAGTEKKDENTKYYVYLLEATGGSKYVGATIDLDPRLRTHNCEIKGGAHATGIKVSNGEVWERAAYVSGFPDWQAALQFEWRWKQLSRKLSIKLLPLERRMKALKELLALERPTTKAKSYAEWISPPEVTIELEEAKTYFV